MATFAQIQEEIENMLSTPDDLLTEEMRSAMDAYLNELGQQEAGKVDSFSLFLRLQTAHAAAMKEEARRLYEGAHCVETRLERLKEHYVGVMRAAGLKKVAGNIYVISTRKSERVEISVDVDELEEIFVRKKVATEPDKAAIKEALKAGQEVKGCRLVTVESLQVR